VSYDPKALMAEARAALERAYAPYSGFAVGAALKGRSGRTYTGVNVENASLGLSICAERNAVFQAVAHGERAFEAIAIATRADAPTPPCGACRQVLIEFAEDLPVHLAGRSADIETRTLSELVPRAFRTFRP
jgi:cytidine deaminase